MSEGTQVSLLVNDTPRTVDVSPGWRLLELLREGLGLTGTKEGCDDGSCGICTVVVDGKAVRACQKTAVEMVGGDVLTIEGLSSGGQLHALQEAFLESDAVQCGFCIPGMIMAAAALLRRDPQPSRKKIARSLGNVLCRCTGYQGILDAVEWVAHGRQGTPRAWPFETRPGEWRRGGLEKVTGAATYAADIQIDGMLHVRVLRSPHSHAEIIAIDTGRARALPGVEAVLTAEDVPGENSYGRKVKDQPVLAESRVRQVGDPVAAVAATSPEIAAAAVALIEVEYRVLPAVFDPIEALGDGAPLIHPGGNLLAENSFRRGNVEEGFARADLVVEESYTTTWNEHAYLEPEAAVAYVDRDSVVVQSPTQNAYYHRGEVARVLGWPPERVRIAPTVVGGGFGGKHDVSCQPLAALLAVKTGRPVKIVYTRAESFAATTKRHPYWIRYRTGVMRDGRLTAVQMEMLADTGAYASSGPGRITKAFASATGPYHWPSIDFHGRVVYTNNPTAGSMRGPGTMQAAFAVESQMDLMAERLGIDPLELRRRNTLRKGDVLISGQTLPHDPAVVASIECIEPHYQEALTRAEDSRLAGGTRLRGVGVASIWYGIGGGGFGVKSGYGRARVPGRAALELLQDGTVALRTVVMDLGQGSDTVFAMIAATELGLHMSEVAVSTGDTTATEDGGATAGSRVTLFVGNAVREAARSLKEAALSTASEMMGVPKEELELSEGRVTTGADPQRGLLLADIARARNEASLTNTFEGVFDSPTSMYDADAGLGEPYPAYVSATQVAEVEVDTVTGQVEVLRVVAAHDAGRPVFPQGVVGQIEGGIVMGLGFALKERYIPGKTTGLLQYRIPRSRHAPDVLCLLVRETDPAAADQPKGLAECSSMAVAPAIANAISHATGERVFDLPVALHPGERRDEDAHGSAAEHAPALRQQGR